jgi:hypothetical protein
VGADDPNGGGHRGAGRPGPVPKRPSPRRLEPRPTAVATGRSEPTEAPDFGVPVGPRALGDDEPSADRPASGWRAADGAAREHRETSLHQLAEAVRAVRDPRGPPPAWADPSGEFGSGGAAGAPENWIEPLARAAGGLAWEEPAGRALPMPSATRVAPNGSGAPLVSAGGAGAARAGRVVATVGAASLGGGGAASPGAIASTGRLAAAQVEDDGDDAEDAPDPGAWPNADRGEDPVGGRVRSGRQVALLLLAGMVFLGAGGAAVWVMRATNGAGLVEAVTAAVTPADPAAEAAKVATIKPALESGEPGGAVANLGAEPKREPAATPPEPKPPPRPVDKPQEPSPFERELRDDPPKPVDAAKAPADPATKSPPADKPPPPKPPPKPTGGGKLLIHADASFGGANLYVDCDGPRATHLIRAGVTTVTGIAAGCDLRITCVGDNQPVRVQNLIGKSEAWCTGCDRRSGPICK